VTQNIFQLKRREKRRKILKRAQLNKIKIREVTLKKVQLSNKKEGEV
jgi:hypothetical protein